MSGVTDLYFPSADARELNGDLRKEHLVFLADHPDWAPPGTGLGAQILGAFSKPSRPPHASDRTARMDRREHSSRRS